MSRWSAWIQELTNDETVPVEQRLRVIAALKEVDAVQAKQRMVDSVPMDEAVVLLLNRAARYLILADRLHSTGDRTMLAILLAVCDLQKPNDN